MHSNHKACLNTDGFFHQVLQRARLHQQQRILHPLKEVEHVHVWKEIFVAGVSMGPVLRRHSPSTCQDLERQRSPNWRRQRTSSSLTLWRGKLKKSESPIYLFQVLTRRQKILTTLIYISRSEAVCTWQTWSDIWLTMHQWPQLHFVSLNSWY